MPGVCPPRLYSRTCQYPTRKGKFLKSIETAAQRCSVKKVFLEISQNSPENTCARVSILIKSCRPETLRPTTLLKKRLWHRCLPVKFAKFLRIPFFTKTLRWLLLRARNFASVPRPCTIQNTSNSLAKAHLKTPFKCQLLFLKKGKTETISFSYVF